MERDWLTSGEAMALCGFAREHLAYLCRTNKIICEKRGRDWFIQRTSLLAYFQDWHPDIFERFTKRGE